MSSTHRALVVEDHPRTAADLAQMLRSMGIETLTSSNKEDALATLEREPLCLVLLDLSIPPNSRRTKSRPEVGISVLQEIRRRFGSRRNAKTWLPIVVVSGHAREPDEAVELMKLDADDVIQKPYREAEIKLKVTDALRTSGRDKHDSCAGLTHAPPGSIVISIPGRTVKGRTVALVRDEEVQLTDSALVALLRLLVAHVKRVSVPLRSFDKNSDVAYKVVDRLRTALRGAVENPTEFLVNQRGAYALEGSVHVGFIAHSSLVSHHSATVRELSSELANATR